MKHPLLILLSVCLAGAVYAEETLYQYTDEQGNKIISSTLPSDAANRGYSIISTRGNVIEKVPPKLTDEQIKEVQHQQALEEKNKEEQALLEKEKKLQEKKDAMLLKMFTNVDDIKRSRDDKVETIKTQENISRENLQRLEEQLKRAQAAVEAHKQQNSAIPKQLLDTIEESKNQISDNQVFLKSKAEEKKQIEERYEYMIKRFTELTQPEPQEVNLPPQNSSNPTQSSSNPAQSQ